jgi:hypothetical protein
MYKNKDGRIEVTNMYNSQRLVVRNADLGTVYATAYLVDLDVGKQSFLLGTEIAQLADMFSEVAAELKKADERIAATAAPEADPPGTRALMDILDAARSGLPADTLFDGDPCGIWRRKLDAIAAIAAGALEDKEPTPVACGVCSGSGLDLRDPCGECGGSGIYEDEKDDARYPA